MDDRLGEPINYQFAERNKTLNWFHKDTEELAQRLGTTEHVEYRFNDWGFRMDLDMHEVPEGCDIYLGDSNLLGGGINLEDTWAWKMHHEYLKNEKPFVSLASMGASDDTYYRLLAYWIPKLKPARVFVYNGQGYRMENVSHSNGIVGYGPWNYSNLVAGARQELPDSFEKQLFLQLITCPLDRKIREQRNRDATVHLCSKLGVELHYVLAPELIALKDRGISKEWYGEARDTIHAGVNQQIKHLNNFISLTNL